jgi:hypothetical protein
MNDDGAETDDRSLIEIEADEKKGANWGGRLDYVLVGDVSPSLAARP